MVIKSDPELFASKISDTLHWYLVTGNTLGAEYAGIRLKVLSARVLNHECQ
jgi:hypothetical protein